MLSEEADTDLLIELSSDSLDQPLKQLFLLFFIVAGLDLAHALNGFVEENLDVL